MPRPTTAAAPPATEDTLEAFHGYVGAQLAAGRRVSPELALALWRARLREADAVREGLAALDRGDTRPAEEFLRELDAEFGLNGGIADPPAASGGE